VRIPVIVKKLVHSVKEQFYNLSHSIISQDTEDISKTNNTYWNNVFIDTNTKVLLCASIILLLPYIIMFINGLTFCILDYLSLVENQFTERCESYHAP